MVKKMASPSSRSLEHAVNVDRGWTAHSGGRSDSTNVVVENGRVSEETFSAQTSTRALNPQERRALLENAGLDMDAAIEPNKKAQKTKQAGFVMALTLAASVGGFLFG
jgi:hypothetical protein